MYRRLLICLTFMIFQMVLAGELTAVIDLEKELFSDFVLETKKIKIPGYPCAFNPSITEWNEHYLLSFRSGKTTCGELTSCGTLIVRDANCLSDYSIGLILLDRNFEVIGEVQLLDLPKFHDATKVQDPRFVKVRDKTFMVYSDAVPGAAVSNKRRMIVVELKEIEGKFYVKNPRCLVNFDNEDEWIKEKNWVPFAYEDSLFLAQYLCPHKIVTPLESGDGCLTFCSSEVLHSWEWGELRGGTQALKVSDSEYLAIFHSSIVMASQQSKRKKMQHYFMGAYTFSAAPPFNVTGISEAPIVGERFYNGPAYITWKPLRVVFPGGMLLDQDVIWIAYGRQDHEVWVCKIDKKGLINSLKRLPLDS